MNDKCLVCKKKIAEEDFNFEDYFTIMRGSSAKFGYIHFDCFHLVTNPGKTVIFDKNGVKAKL